MTAPIRVLCVDDHRIVREGIALIVSREPDMEVVGLAGSGHEAVTLFESQRPDVTLMDLRLGATSGLDAIRTIRSRHADARIVVLTMYQGDEDVHGALAAGASTYLLKETVPDELIHVIRQVHAGERPLPAGIRAVLDEHSSRRTLTPREVEVMQLIAGGKRNKEVATILGIAERTVNVHLKNIFAKLEVSERTSAVNVALRRGIVHLD